jgi:peptidylprolyl isomerase
LARVGCKIRTTIFINLKGRKDMPKSRRPHRSVKPEKKSDQNLYVRIAAIAVIVVVIGAIIWAIGSSYKPAASVPQSTVVKTLQYASAPAMTIDKSKQYTATFTMAKGGQFVIQLYPDKAPIAVNSFVFLARQHYFDGITFHRVLSGFMAQGGDPTGTGTGGPGYTFDNEISDLKFDKAGVLAMANTGQPNSNGSQFFITFGPQTTLDGGYTIFGQVTSGMDVVNNIRLRDPNQNPTYQGDAIQTVTIQEK